VFGLSESDFGYRNEIPGALEGVGQVERLRSEIRELPMKDCLLLVSLVVYDRAA
jgi:hypothetical protein